MIKKLFSGQINSIMVAALLVAMSSLASRFLGVFRDRILAGEFGAGDTLDIYYAAFRIPDFIFNLLILGALSAGFIPIITGLIRDHECKKEQLIFKNPNKEVWELSSNILNILGIAMFGISLVGIIFAPWIMKVITPGFGVDKQAQVVSLTRIMFLSPLFLGISSVLGGILQSFKRFFVYSFSPIMYNLGIILGALYLVPLWGVYGLAWGVVFGSFLHMLIQLPVIFSMGFKYQAILNFKDKNIIKIGRMMGPRIMSLGISQIELLSITVIASTLPSGSLSVFNFANNLQSFPIGVFGISLAIAAFPTLSAVAFNEKKLVENFSNVFRQIMFFIIPAMVLFLTLRAQIVRVVLGSGSFDWNDTVLTFETLKFFAFSLFSQAALPLLARVFYARHNSKMPFYVGIFSAAINVGLALYFVRSGDISSLALSFSIANTLNFVLLWIMLRREVGRDLDEKRIITSILKLAVAGVFAGWSIQSAKIMIAAYVNMDKLWGVFLQGFIAGMIGLLVFAAFASLLRSEEFFYFWNAFKKRIPWRKIETGDQGEARGI
ncbi:murein biosynthesis integral membrane protein MurJ [Candidatus Parcubacteria bacterium]|nr:murein biosynthesis integral membrane protein MurJ [Patescibacteria group bacterium]MBU4309202.1 murein biosynthesis integral membrane protein MurJ [Patescibacteria group bacterium]MBU4432634.1 murein biosynthesis integral membrane protein MurJ [Patescibacteria group bacterium]MBU4577563.1 murein biosynthesis integral membrane protein MurJ [Patescibacteria group bacterium]MCG2697250.1 murein biosynthesis integral membrane protein MurJ [Candidatus Parcubacteria bacterium]